MRIWLDLQRMTRFGLTPQDVIDAVPAQNAQAAVRVEETTSAAD